MRSIGLLLGSTLMAAFLLSGAAAAQPPIQNQVPPGGVVRPAPISVDDLVERIMAFDKNKDGKVTREELPERMHHLIAQGDTNKDGALDRDEIKKLAAKLATAPRGPGGARAITLDRRDIRFGPGPGPRTVGGFGRGGVIGFGPDAVEGVVDDLKLSGKKKAQAMAAAKDHEKNVRKLLEQARGQLLLKMKEILSAEEFEDFKAALDRPRGRTVIVGPGPPR